MRRSRSSRRSWGPGITSPRAPTISLSPGEKSGMSNRRKFLLVASGTVAAATTAVVGAPNVIAQQKIQWRMSTGYTASFDVLHHAAERLAKTVEEMSGGRLRIEVFPGGQIMQPLDCFDATSKGTIQAFMG